MAGPLGIDPSTPILGGIFGGGSSSGQPDPSSFIQYYQQMANGTHLIQQPLVNGKVVGAAQDLGPTALKTAPTDKPVLKTLGDGSTWAFAFNPDGTVKASQQLGAPKNTDAALGQYRDAESTYIEQKSAEAEAMAPYNADKAAATIANLKSQIQQRTDLDPARIQSYLARVTDAQTRAKISDSTVQKNNALGALDQAKANAMIAPIGAQLAGEIAQLHDNLKSGTIDQATYDQQYQGLIDQATQAALTGMNASQRQKALTDSQTALTNSANAFSTAQNDAMSSANNRMRDALTYQNNVITGMSDLAKGGPPGQTAPGQAANDYLKQAPSWLASMGGGAVTPQDNPFLAQLKAASPSMGGADPSQAQVTPQHMQTIQQLIAGGMDPKSAVMTVAKQAGVDTSVFANDPNVGVTPNGAVNPNVDPGLTAHLGGA